MLWNFNPTPTPPLHIAQESHEAVVFRLLDEVIAAELVTTTIRSKVVPYVERHQMQLNSTLLNYIKVGVGVVQWQARATVAHAYIA